MPHDPPRPLDAEALALFARKGMEGGPGVPQTGDHNAVKVRRVLQLTADFAPVPFPRLRILDLGCGEGAYTIEAGLRGAQVVAVDAREQRLRLGAACAARHGLDNVRFLQEDVRRLERARHGEFDVVYALGILYHLDAPDLFPLLRAVRSMCRRFAVIETALSPDAPEQAVWEGRAYGGRRVREHDDSDSAELRRSRLLKSIDNPWSFRFDRRSLLAALHDAGFSSLLECHAPLEPGKPADRITLVAAAGEPVGLSTYPWINGRDEAEIERRLSRSG